MSAASPKIRDADAAGLPPPDLPPDIHVVIDDRDTGPLEAAEVSALVALGRAGPRTLAWHPALDDWAQIGTLPEMAQLLIPEIATVPQPLALAPAGRRILAGAIDLALWLSLTFSMGLALSVAARLMGAAADPLAGWNFDLLAQSAGALYFIILMSRIGGGATPGYHLLGLRLVDRRRLQPPGVASTCIWYVTSFLRSIGFVTVFFDPRRRMLHNMISGTLVVVVREPAS